MHGHEVLSLGTARGSFFSIEIGLGRFRGRSSPDLRCTVMPVSHSVPTGPVSVAAKFEDRLKYEKLEIEVEM